MKIKNIKNMVLFIIHKHLNDHIVNLMHLFGIIYNWEWDLKKFILIIDFNN